MLVQARGTRGGDLDPDVLAASGNDALAVFNVTLDQTYGVCSMALWQSGLAVLLLSDSGRPDWYHLDLFTVLGRKVPASWSFGLTPRGGPVRAIWGYESMVADAHHHDALIERELGALAVFLRECSTDDMTEHDKAHMRTLRDTYERSR